MGGENDSLYQKYTLFSLLEQLQKTFSKPLNIPQTKSCTQQVRPRKQNSLFLRPAHIDFMCANIKFYIDYDVINCIM